MYPNRFSRKFYLEMIPGLRLFHHESKNIFTITNIDNIYKPYGVKSLKVLYKVSLRSEYNAIYSEYYWSKDIKPNFKIIGFNNEYKPIL